MKKFFVSATCLVSLILLFSFKQKDKGFQELPKIIRNDYVFVPEGKVFIGRDTARVGSFYICKTELSNIAYREFIYDLKKEGKQAELAMAFVDTEKWKSKLVYNEPYVNYYFQFPAYDYYPVVNVSYEGAQLYCKWLTEKLNGKFSHNYTYEVRLPSCTEWMRAARLDKQSFPYTWGGPYLRNSRGRMLCNYKSTGDENVHYDTVKHDYVVLGNDFDNINAPAPIYSYYPNLVGAYNMNGNVAEMVAEKGVAVGGSWNSTGNDVGNESTMNYTEPSPIVGFRPILIVKKK